MTISEAVAAIEKVLGSWSAVVSSQVRPSGDDVDAIKVWVDLGETKVDTDAWAAKIEAEIRKQVPGAARYRIVVRAETGL